MTTIPVPVHIRWQIRRDLASVLAIEQASFEYGWTEQDFLQCLRHRNCISMVAAYREQVVGFMVYELHAAHLQLLNFAVIPGYRRRGVGRQLVDKLKAKLCTHRHARLDLFIRETNLPAQLFFASCGCRAMRVVRGHYQDSGEDAYQFRYGLDPIWGPDSVPVNRITQYEED